MTGSLGARPGPTTKLVHRLTLDGAGRVRVFLVAGAFGNPMNLCPLAQALADCAVVYGVQARGLADDRVQHTSIVEAAADYLREIRTIQPVGPYVLGGFCSGGLIAADMARQLREDGEDTSLLILLDSSAIAIQGRLSLGDKLRIHLQNLRGSGPSYAIRWLLDRTRSQVNTASSGVDARAQAVFDATIAAVRSYSIRPHRGPAVLFRPPMAGRYRISGGRVVDDTRELVSADNGWSPFIEDLTVHEVGSVPGDHDGILLPPQATTIAHHLRASLRSTQELTRARS